MKREELVKSKRKARRVKRIRAKLLDLKSSPRLSVFRSNNHIYAQIIDDVKGETLVSASDKEVEAKGNRTQIAEELGKTIAKKAIDKKIKSVAFDKGSYKYHGRVKALAEGARKEGLQF
ncbi:MAG TPA: 50S ribosomal protein L18 [Patescibacteria group bacterium]|nr:50S ribosomal protein L18 [Patescibacteria group bacterium]